MNCFGIIEFGLFDSNVVLGQIKYSMLFQEHDLLGKITLTIPSPNCYLTLKAEGNCGFVSQAPAQA